MVLYVGVATLAGRKLLQWVAEVLEYLLSQGEDFEGEVAATTEEDADGGEYGEEEFQHEPTLLPWRNTALTGRPPQTANC